ncbi:MAG TPA: hypothetical protein VHC43_02975 [Mycobacteriales bacterium]|nr:hypothetical protein [Mycobacteriales bacterium]
MRQTPLETHAIRPYRATAGLAVVALAAVPALAACSSSSSSGKPVSKAEASASAIASKLGVTPIPSLAPGGHGPNGDISAPASNAPSKTSPGGSEVFPNVTSKERDKIGTHLTKLPGVQTVTYYPQFRQLQIYFTSTATAADRAKVYRYVTKHVPAAAGSPSASPAATASASPTASTS